jgi:hypothetical protein
LKPTEKDIENSELQTKVSALTAERDNYRTLFIQAGRNAGTDLYDQVSTELSRMSRRRFSSRSQISRPRQIISTRFRQIMPRSMRVRRRRGCLARFDRAKGSSQPGPG